MKTVNRKKNREKKNGGKKRGHREGRGVKIEEDEDKGEL